MSGRCLEGVWKDLEGVWKDLEGVWKVSGGCLEGVWKVSGGCLAVYETVSSGFFVNVNFVRVLAFEPIPNQVRLRDLSYFRHSSSSKVTSCHENKIRGKLAPQRFRYQKLASFRKKNGKL